MANENTIAHNNVQLEEEGLARERKRKSTRITIGVHALFILLAFFVKCDHEKAVDNQYAVAINFEEIVEPEPEKLEVLEESSNSAKSQSTEGAAKKTADKPAEIEEVEQKVLKTTVPEVKIPKPTPPTPTPTEPVISETVVDDMTEVTAVEEAMEIEEVELEPVPDPAPDPEPVPDPEPAPKTNTSILDQVGSILDVFKDKKGGSKDEGNPKGDPSRSDGSADGTGKGDKGTGKGNDKSGNDGDSGRGSGGISTGNSGGSGQGINGRSVIWKPHRSELIPKGLNNQSGKLISVKVCFNRDGIVEYAELLEKETDAEINSTQLKEIIRGFKKYKFEVDRSAPEEVCGKLKLRIAEINTLR